MRLYNAIKGIFYEINENWYSTNYIEPSSTLVEYLNEYQNFKLTVTDETIDELSNFEDVLFHLRTAAVAAHQVQFHSRTAPHSIRVI